MGNCFGSLFGSGSSGGGPTQQANNLSRHKSKREQNWAVTGQITLRDGNLKELPGSIRSVGTAAKVLDASNNKLAAVSPALGELTSLQRLILANNALISLEHIESLKKLKVLVIDSNRLTQLPEEIGALTKLERLQCSRNALSSLPAVLGRLPALTFFACSGNKIGALPPELGGASALEELDASDNYLKGLPEALGSLHRLKTINVDKNQITAVPAAVLKGCEALQTLSLHSNPITAEDLRNVDGFEEFERRRREKVDKQLSGGAAYNLDESVDRVTAN